MENITIGNNNNNNGNNNNINNNFMSGQKQISTSQLPRGHIQDMGGS